LDTVRLSYSLLRAEIPRVIASFFGLSGKTIPMVGFEPLLGLGQELIAELGAAFLCGDLGIALEPRADHACYVKNWLQVLKNDKKAIFTAASKASQAANWLIDQEDAA
jgi:hypothetical protein